MVVQVHSITASDYIQLLASHYLNTLVLDVSKAPLTLPATKSIPSLARYMHQIQPHSIHEIEFGTGGFNGFTSPNGRDVRVNSRFFDLRIDGFVVVVDDDGMEGGQADLVAGLIRNEGTD